MSKIAIFLAVPALLGAGVLTVVSLDLAAELEATRDRVEDLEAALRAVEDRPAAAASRTGERRDEARLRALEDRVAAMERGAGGAPEGAASAAVAEPDASTPLAASGTEIERTVEAVLEARDAERRLERREQMVTRGTERLLRDVQVTPEQRGQVEALFADYVRRLSEMRDQDLGPELAPERAAELRDELRRGLEGVLDATQMATVGQRLERRAGDDGGRRAERRGGRRGGGRRAVDGDS